MPAGFKWLEKYLDQGFFVVEVESKAWLGDYVWR